MLNKITELLTNPFFEKLKIKWKLKKIKSFQKQYEDTFVDSNTFQKFLNEERNGLLIFNYVFGSTYNSITKDAFVEQLSEMAMNKINKYRKSVQLEELECHPVIKQYFSELITYLEEYRNESFKSNEMSILANIQSSIVESNDGLREYFEKNLYEIQQRAYIKKYTDEYLEELLERNILDLGKRYNSEANVETAFNVIFDSLVSDKSIPKNFTVLMDEFKNSIMNLNVVLDSYKEDVELKDLSFIEETLTYLKHINYNDTEFYLDNSLKNFRKEINRFMGEVERIRYKFYEETKKSIKGKVVNIINQINKHERAIVDYIESVKPMLINEPYLLVYGDAGIGKSHLLADNAKRLQEAGHSVFLFLGQHLNTHDHPFKQLFDLIDYEGSKESFFKEFNDRAKKKNKRTVIIIDALNEGEGKYFWKGYLLNFLNTFKKFDNIAIVLSIRSNYLKSILPENIYEDFPLYKLEHRGFNNLSLEALEPFFNFYKINPIIFPSLENECYNPLFLQIYCEAIEEEYVGFRGWSIVQVLEKYIKKVNDRLSLDKRFSYLNSLNLIDKILKKIASEFIESERYGIKLERLYEVIEDVAKPYTSGYREILLGLAEENILSINEMNNGEDLVYFTYERFADIYISLVLLERYQQDENLFKDILSLDNPYYYGVFESLSIVIPDKLKVEWLDLIDNELITFDIAEAFVRGISWRNVQNINERTFWWINLCLGKKDIDLQSLIYERLLKQSYIIESPLNAEYLHDVLNEMSMSIRDENWTISINNNSEVPTRLLEIILERNLSYKHFESGNFELLSTTIIWLFTCTDRKLRDIATTALVNLYMNEPSIILKDIKRFIGVNDPYVLERLFASVYGAILRTNEVPQLNEIVDIIYTNIFKQDEVYQNVLIRDYAGSIILFAVNKGSISLEEYDGIASPHSSSWYKKTYSLQDIDNKLKEMQQTSGEVYCGFHSIVRSMTTEYGRGTGAYGDFGRYVFGSALHDWRNQFNDQDLSNIATMRIIEYGYDEKTHGYYDRNLRNYNRHENLVERIGKKYQWIALYELLAKLADNYPIYKEIKRYTPEYEKYKELQNQKIYEYARKLFSMQSEEEIRLLEQEPEEILKEEEHFLGIEKEYYKTYNGPWDPFLRTIDPSLLNYPPEKNIRNLIKSNLPNNPNKIWAQSKEEFKGLGDFIFIEYEGEKYISLAQLLIQNRDHGKKIVDKDEFCIKTKAVFLPLKEKENYIDFKSVKKGDLSVSWANTHTVFAFEHYWHPAFRDMFYENEFDNIKCEDSVWEYLWEKNINSISGERGSCSYLLPNPNLVRFFELDQTSEGVWKDKLKNLVAFDAQYLGYESNLLFRADYLEEYLKENNLSVVWDCYMEKMSERSRKEEWFICWIDDKKDINYKILDEYKDMDMKDMF
ncbi:ATP-binding protein [Bacillus sp. AR2-1]|uniref:ATP-binding protein n=1 Tax=Bacillus sp. AR2-1 TaxID=2217816 RepID=UPI0011ED1EB5|nr:ATP-binding protein [Bacillus sp. AR2-1]KAA0776247.1 ATP-binding protein [Bacillus sp. AR2-1]